MAEQEAPEAQVEPQDPEYDLQEHIAYKRKQEALNTMLRRLIQDGLADFKLIMDGTAFSYTKLALPNKGITSVSEVIAEYPHLRQLDLSSNCIQDVNHIQKLRFVTHLNLNRNCIKDARLLSNSALFPFVKNINLSNNKLKALPNVQLVRLEHLNLNNNQIDNIQMFCGHPTLEILELRGNKLVSLKDISKAPKLKQLYLADNCISCLKGIGELPCLEKLHLRKNKITELNQFPKLVALQYLNVRQNQIAKLQVLRGIVLRVRILNLLANPISEEMGDNTKKQVWMKYRQYDKINKSQMTAQQREEFDKEYKDKIAEQERIQKQERQAKEQAERQAAEAAAAQKAE